MALNDRFKTNSSIGNPTGVYPSQHNFDWPFYHQYKEIWDQIQDKPDDQRFQMQHHPEEHEFLSPKNEWKFHDQMGDWVRRTENKTMPDPMAVPQLNPQATTGPSGNGAPPQLDPATVMRLLLAEKPGGLTGNAGPQDLQAQQQMQSGMGQNPMLHEYMKTPQQNPMLNEMKQMPPQMPVDPRQMQMMQGLFGNMAPSTMPR